MKQSLVAILLILICGLQSFAKDDKSDRKLRSAIEKEEQRFQKNREKNPNDANTYWEHANHLCEFNTEFRRAQEYYKKALQFDSVNGAIYKDYGKYLYEKLYAIDDAKAILTKGLSYAGDNEEMKKYLNSVNTAIVRRDEEMKLRDVGSTTIKELNPTGNYSSMTNFDSLKKILSDGSNARSYRKLRDRYLQDDKTLTPEEMFFLIIGYSKEKEYNPFNYSEISAMKQLAGYSIDSAISRGVELTGTNPLNPSLNRELMYYYRKKNDTITANKYLYRVHQYFNGMLYSGNGTCQKPYISLWSKEDNNFISYLGYKPTDSHAMATCAGQMAEIADVIDPVSGQTENICFNLKLIYLQTTGK